MTVLEKIKRCVSLVWDFQEIYGEEDIEEFCHNELSTYPQHDEIMEYFKHIEELEKENAELRNNGFTVSAMTEQQLKEALEKGERLEKENAELKKQLRDKKCNNKDCPVFITLVQAIKERAETSKQLTKAKELLLELYDCIPSSMADSCKETLQKVALFFKDSEVEK